MYVDCKKTPWWSSPHHCVRVSSVFHRGVACFFFVRFIFSLFFHEHELMRRTNYLSFSFIQKRCGLSKLILANACVFFLVSLSKVNFPINTALPQWGAQFSSCPCPESLATVPWTLNCRIIATAWSFSISHDHAWQLFNTCDTDYDLHHL